MQRANAFLKAVLIAGFFAVCLAPTAGAQSIVFQQPPDGTGNLLQSSWVDPNGSDADWYVYDNFTLPTTQDVNEVRWRGGYIYNAVYGTVQTFSIVFYESIAGGSQPHVVNPQLPEIYLAWYDVPNNAGETYAGTWGGKALYDYHFHLPTPFHATGGVKYWIRIEGAQLVYPDWGIATGSGGDNIHFWFSTGLAMFNFGSGDAAFALLAPVATDVAPAATGTLSLAVSPNPTRRASVVSFNLPVASALNLDVFDAAGRRVRNLLSGSLQAGGHMAAWDGLDERGAPVAAGICYVRLETPGGTQVRRTVVVR